jgi:hypothetical protein
MSAGALLALSSVVSPAAQARADKTLNVTYTCSGGPFTNASLTAAIVVPDRATGTFDVTWKFPSLTLETVPSAPAQVKVAASLEVTGGTHADLDAAGASVTSGTTSVPEDEVTSTVTVSAAAGGEVTIRPATGADSLVLYLSTDPNELTACSTTSTQSVTVRVGQGGDTGGGDGTGTDVVEYRCTDKAGATQDVKIRTTLTMPSSPKTGEQFVIGWAGTYVTGSELKVPAAGLASGVKLYAYASISGLSQLTSATGVGMPASATAGQAVTLPASVEMKTTSRNAGTATVKPAAVNLGTTPQERLIECEVRNADALKTYRLTVAAGNGTPSPSSTPTTTPSATRTPTSTPSARTSATPKDGVATGGGGEAGPDGRMYVLTGSALLLAAGTGGLLMRRRARPRPAP